MGTCSSIGGYSLSLAAKPPPGVIGYGQQVTGRILVTGDYDVWRFSGQAGEVITIRLLQEGGATLPPKVVLLDPSGALEGSMCVSSGYNKGEARLENHKLKFSGTYTIHASGCFGSSAGGYRLMLERR
jgi:hypothetical protein